MPVAYSASDSGLTTIYTHYNMKEYLLKLCPLKDGFKRTYVIMSSINTGNGSISIYINDYKVLGAAVWGSYSQYHSRCISADITDIIDSLGSSGHCLIKVQNDNGVFFFVNRIDLLIYDEPI